MEKRLAKQHTNKNNYARKRVSGIFVIIASLWNENNNSNNIYDLEYSTSQQTGDLCCPPPTNPTATTTKVQWKLKRFFFSKITTNWQRVSDSCRQKKIIAFYTFSTNSICLRKKEVKKIIILEKSLFLFSVNLYKNF